MAAGTRNREIKTSDRLDQGIGWTGRRTSQEGRGAGLKGKRGGPLLWKSLAGALINIRQVPWEVLKHAAFGLSFQHLPWDLANVNAWKNMFDPYIKSINFHTQKET